MRAAHFIRSSGPPEFRLGELDHDLLVHVGPPSAS